MNVYNILNISLTNESFKSQNSSEFQLSPQKTKDNIKFEIKTAHLKDNIHEVSMNVFLNVSTEDDSFLYEAQVMHTGIFEISGFEPDEFDKVVKVHCATALYPYCRQRIHNIIGESPFHIGMLPTINFSKIYEDEAFKNTKLAEQELKGNK